MMFLTSSIVGIPSIPFFVMIAANNLGPEVLYPEPLLHEQSMIAGVIDIRCVNGREQHEILPPMTGTADMNPMMHKRREIIT